MANKNRSDIIAQVYEYIPNLNVSSHDTTVDNLIDLAAEEISSRFNFSYLAANAPATHAVVADEYYIDEADFGFTDFKEILFLEWIKPATGENARITHLPKLDFLNRFRYIEYSDNTTSKPSYYTRLGTRYLFNIKVDEEITVRAWYQQYHGAFATDDTPHEFSPDMLGFNAIVSGVLAEAQVAIPALVLTNKAVSEASRKEFHIQKLIEADNLRTDEGMEIGFMNRGRGGGMGLTSPYDWT